MRRPLIALTLGLWGTVLCAQGSTTQQVAIGSSLTIQVADRDASAALLMAKAEALGGYFSALTPEALTLKLPADQARELIDYVKANWKPVEESYRSEDMMTSLDQLRARLKAKQELYERFEKLLANADAADIIEVAAEASKLIGEIEQLKGRLRAAQHRIAFATVVLNFRLLQRERPHDDGGSPFAWLNELGLETLLRGFER